MTPQHVLVIEDCETTARETAGTLEAAGIAHRRLSDTQSAWRYLHNGHDFDLLILRLQSPHINCVSMCSELRSRAATSELPILILATCDDLSSQIDAAIQAGATDVLRLPFKPRELRYKARNAAGLRHCRVDQKNAQTCGSRLPAVHFNTSNTVTELTNNLTTASDSEQKEEQFMRPTLIVPEFDPVSCRFLLPVDAQQVQEWEADQTVRKIVVDQVLTCPKCRCLLTIRSGCRCCGTALTESPRLIHHYACAHVAPESEFRDGEDLVCPKCLKRKLVAGSDFEIVGGAATCSECDCEVNEPALIAHCVRCRHRFPLEEAIPQTLTGYEVLETVAGTEESDHQPAGTSSNRAIHSRQSAGMRQPFHAAAGRRRAGKRRQFLKGTARTKTPAPVLSSRTLRRES